MIKTIKITDTQSINNAKNLLGGFRYYFNALIESKSYQSDNKVNPDYFIRENAWNNLSKKELTNIGSQFNASNDMSFVSKKQKHGYILEHKNRWSVNNNVVTFEDFDISFKISKYSRISNVELYYNKGKYYISIETVKNKRPKKEKLGQIVASDINVEKSPKKVIRNTRANLVKGVNFSLCCCYEKAVGEKQAQFERLQHKLVRGVCGSKRNGYIYSKLMKLDDEYVRKERNVNRSLHRYKYERAERRENRRKAYYSLSISEIVSKNLLKAKRRENAIERNRRKDIFNGLADTLAAIHKENQKVSDSKDIRAKKTEKRILSKVDRASKGKRSKKDKFTLTELHNLLVLSRESLAKERDEFAKRSSKENTVSGVLRSSFINVRLNPIGCI